MYRGLKVTAIIAAAGRGSRMKKDVNKQYLMLVDKPVLAHTLEVFQSCRLIDRIVVVTAREEIDFCKNELVDKYGYTKVS